MSRGLYLINLQLTAQPGQKNLLETCPHWSNHSVKCIMYRNNSAEFRKNESPLAIFELETVT